MKAKIISIIAIKLSLFINYSIYCSNIFCFI